MIPEARRRYNAAFSPARYQEMLADIERQLPGQLDFRVAESPVFVPPGCATSCGPPAKASST